MGAVMSREAHDPGDPYHAPKKTRQARRRSGEDPGVGEGGYRDLHDEPCYSGRAPLWPGGPALPLWAEREMQRGL